MIAHVSTAAILFGKLLGLQGKLCTTSMLHKQSLLAGYTGRAHASRLPDMQDPSAVAIPISSCNHNQLQGTLTCRA